MPEPLRRRSAALLLAGGVLLGAGIAAAVIELEQATAHRHALVPNRLLRIDRGPGACSATRRSVRRRRTSPPGREGVWVVNGDDQTISLADASTRRIETTFGIGQTPTDVALGGGAAWVGDGAPTPAGVIGAASPSASRASTRARGW